MKKVLYCIILSLTTLWDTEAIAQDNLPYTTSAVGGYGTINSQLYDFSIGEMVLVNTFSTGPYLFSQGFLQPYFVTGIAVTDLTIINNVITPNGDGKNDAWQVRNLDRYPDHKVSIFDRAGRLLFQTKNYQNDWQGLVNGKPLNEDAYYYVIDPGKGYGLIKGSITIVRDK